MESSNKRFPKLYMLLIGCTPSGRHTEQHDVFFGIAHSIGDLIPELIQFWPEAKSKIHIDAWREVTLVNGFEVSVHTHAVENTHHLFFINLGGYKKDEFEEFHYKMIVAAKDKGEAIQLAKKTAFYKHTGFRGANSHIDDKYGVDVDDTYLISDILPTEMKSTYHISIRPAVADKVEDEIHLGYFRIDQVEKWSPRT